MRSRGLPTAIDAVRNSATMAAPSSLAPEPGMPPANAAPSGPTYRVGGLTVTPGDPAYQGCLEAAHRARNDGPRPLCLCVRSGAEMYVSRIGGGYLLKRMPGRGAKHAWNCPSYEPPAELSGLGEVLGGAIQEDPVDGVTALRLGFSLSKVSRRGPAANEGEPADSATSSGARLSLRGLLHFLWEDAGFNSWSPAMAGKRSWPVLHRHLLAAIERKRCRGAPLSESLYLPEPWDERRKDEIAARRRAVFLKLASVRKSPRRLMLLLGEVRLIEPGRYGHRLIVKHAPDVEFGLDDALEAAMRRRFETELSAWEGEARGRGVRLIVLGTFAVGLSGRPALEELVLMTVDKNWLPIEDAFDGALVERLVAEERRFTRCLRYNLAASRPLACALLPDAQPEPTALYIVRPGVSEAHEAALEAMMRTSGLANWAWRPAEGPWPELPGRRAAPSSGLTAAPAFDPFNVGAVNDVRSPIPR